MALDIWFREDIANALMAAAQATEVALDIDDQGDGYKAGYRQGYRAALVTLALAFGIPARAIILESGSVRTIVAEDDGG